MILLIGAPCTGKSTIGSLLCELLNKQLVTLDDFIHDLVRENNIGDGEVLKDDLIDQALKKMLEQMTQSNRDCQRIYELPYHDYVSLFRQKLIPASAIIFGLETSFQTILARNQMREIRNQIPEPYLKRCFNSMNELIVRNYARIVFYNTEQFSESQIVELIRGVLDEKK